MRDRMESKWTKTPWNVVVPTEHHGYYINSIDGDIVDLYFLDQRLGKPCDLNNAEANAARIVHCVNNFPELVAALEEQTKLIEAELSLLGTLGSPDRDSALDKARAALKKAKGV